MEAFYSFNKSIVVGFSWDKKGDILFLSLNFLFFEFGVMIPMKQLYDNVDQEIEERRR